MKKVFAVATIAALALLMAIPAQAGVTIKKVNDSSTVSSLAAWLITVLMVNNNNTGVTNTVTSTSNSGNNVHTSADDHSGSEIKTGSSDAVTGVDNQANQNAIDEEYESSDGGSPNHLVEDVNDISVVTATHDDTADNDMTNNNLVDLSNNADADADSGNNAVTSGDSLSDSTTDSGDALGATSVINGFNINVKAVVRRIMSLIP